MFDSETLEDINNLELALSEIPDKEIAQEEKETAFQKVKNYFAGNVKYVFYENGTYSYSRTLSRDLKSIKNYFFKKK